MRLCQLTTIATIAILTATATNAQLPIQPPEVACESKPGYVLCEARTDDNPQNYNWTTTGPLAINLASGPLVSIRCEDGDTGRLMLERSSETRSERSCLEIQCGRTQPAQSCSEEGNAGPTAASIP